MSLMNRLMQVCHVVPVPQVEAAGKSVLTLGSGDGSQQVAIAKAGHRRLTTTFLDSESQVRDKYPGTAPANIEYLRSNGMQV